MNATGFSDDYNATFVANESFQHSDVNHNGRQRQEPVISWDTINLLNYVIRYVVAALGIPGNILSAIVWLRLHVTSKNSSAVYLAALAVNDLLYLLCQCLYHAIVNFHPSPEVIMSPGWFWSVYYVRTSARSLEPLLVLSFSVERLVAIVRPLQVCHLFALHYITLHYRFFRWPK